jgi:hypothetical protein
MRRMWLRFVAGEKAGETVELTGERLVVGRDEGSDLRIEHEKVSRSHAAFELLPGGGWQLMDLGSTNGTFVNGEQLAPQTPRALAGGEQIRIGETTILVSAAEPGRAAPTVVAGAPPTRVSGAPAAAPVAAHEPSPAASRSGGLMAGPGKWVALTLAIAALAGGGIAAGLVLTGDDKEAAPPTPAPPTAVTVVVTETLPAATTAAQDVTAPVETVPAETVPVETEAGGSFNETESALVAHVPESLRSSCRGRGLGEGDPAGTVATIYCESAEGVRVWYFQLDSADAMNAEYDRIVADSPRDSGTCGTDEVAESYYSQGDVTAGRYFCWSDQEFGSVIIWTHDATSILTEASLANGDRAALAAWWGSDRNPLS